MELCDPNVTRLLHSNKQPQRHWKQMEKQKVSKETRDRKTKETLEIENWNKHIKTKRKRSSWLAGERVATAKEGTGDRRQMDGKYPSQQRGAKRPIKREQSLGDS